MSRKRFTMEQIIGLLREVDVKVSQGKNVGQICREIGITEQTYYRWRKEYGGMKTAQVKRLKDDDVLDCLTDLFIRHGAPEHIRSDNGSEFTAKLVRRWLSHIGVKTLYTEPGSPWENGYNESFNGKFRDGLLNGEIFFTLKEVQVLIERWRREYNTIMPHSSLNYRPPAPEATLHL